MAAHDHDACPAKPRFIPDNLTRFPIHTNKLGIAGIASAGSVQVPLVHRWRGPVGFERIAGALVVAVFSHNIHSIVREIQEHAARPIGFREQDFAATHDGTRCHHAKKFIGTPAKFVQHTTGSRVDYQECVSHPGQEPLVTADRGNHRHAVAGQLARRSPPFQARGQIESHQATVQPLDEV